MAYKRKSEDIERQGARNDLTSDRLGQKLNLSIEKVVEETVRYGFTTYGKSGYGYTGYGHPMYGKRRTIKY